MGRQRVRAAAAAASLLLSVVSVPASLFAQAVIRGVLYDDATGTVLRGTVMLVDPVTDAAAAHVVTDSLGQFVLQTPAGGGLYQIGAVLAGYTPVLSARIPLQNGERMTIRIPIATTGDPVHRIGVVEHVKPDTPPAQSRANILGGFESRRATGIGLHFDRAQLASAKASTLGEFLRAVPGLRVIDPSSAASMSTFRDAAPSGVPTRTASGAACHMGWFLDGHRMDLPGQIDPATDGLGLMSLETLEGVEVFRGVSETPPEFAAPDLRCGAVVLWSRRG